MYNYHIPHCPWCGTHLTQIRDLFDISDAPGYLCPKCGETEKRVAIPFGFISGICETDFWNQLMISVDEVLSNYFITINLPPCSTNMVKKNLIRQALEKHIVILQNLSTREVSSLINKIIDYMATRLTRTHELIIRIAKHTRSGKEVYDGFIVHSISFELIDASWRRESKNNILSLIPKFTCWNKEEWWRAQIADSIEMEFLR